MCALRIFEARPQLRGRGDPLVRALGQRRHADKIYVRGFLPAGKGFQWFWSRILKTPEPEFLRELEATGARLALLIRSMQAQRGASSVVVAGFSQGGHLAWYLAARGVVDGAAIASGALPTSFAVPRPSGTRCLMLGQRFHARSMKFWSGCRDC